ncbi:hypothetical protein [Halomonas halmophila]|uniref:HNH domain-containing protein n=1 Tax=Halomonas halmophila TaxID=252 RepID=A0A4Y4F161_9GAMM|nr:hypothetical protein [Halomonas halmophila]GED23013.1 hypothetical protein HHA01_19900 [Halomonas halmophila]
MTGHALSPPSRPERCELCRRAAPLTRHHLIPRTLHGKARYRRRFDRAERLSAILWVCHACHRHIHALFSERELADHYRSREALLGHPEVQTFVAWLATKPAGFEPKRPTRRRR